MDPTNKKRLWQEEHGDAQLPEWVDMLVDAGLLIDTSWHNDSCPSFQIRSGGIMDASTLWIDYPLPEQRENDGPRFYICPPYDDEQAGNIVWESDSEQDALRYLANWAGFPFPLQDTLTAYAAAMDAIESIDAADLGSRAEQDLYDAAGDAYADIVDAVGR